MIDDLTAMELADMVRKSHSYEEFQTICRLELERRENQPRPIKVDCDRNQNRPAVGYYVAAIILLAFGLGSLVIVAINVIKAIMGA